MEYFEKICYFMLIVETFIKLCPNEKYEDYIRMISGFICIMLILTPVLHFLKGEDGTKMPSMSAYEVQLEEILTESQKEMEKELEEKLREGWKIDEEIGVSKQ